MPYLIDTNIAIHARDGTEAVLDRLAEHDGQVLLSALSLGELQRGLYKAPEFTAIRQASGPIPTFATRHGKLGGKCRN